MNYILTAIAILTLFSCKHEDNLTCKGVYRFSKHTDLNEDVNESFKQRFDNNPNLYAVNPFTGRVIWVKRACHIRGTNRAKMYNDDVYFELTCK